MKYPTPPKAPAYQPEKPNHRLFTHKKWNEERIRR